MIHVIETKNRLTLRGHAGYAPRGRDIVCAAVSALFWALAETLEEKKAVQEITVRQGAATIAAKEGCEAELALVQRGLSMLAVKYPQCVQIEK